ncbi:MAG: phage holin family protein [Chloroflexi bacterium]|nr:phage holin family protein [Chloroflexota bacterium]
MIRLTIRVLVYALVLAIAITLSPGITIYPLIPGVVDISATFLLFGILFGLINAFVRPLVLLLQPDWYCVPWAVFAIIINVSLLGLMSWLAGDVLIISEPRLLWLLFGGAVLTIVLMVLESLFGLEMPAFRSARSKPSFTGVGWGYSQTAVVIKLPTTYAPHKSPPSSCATHKTLR